MFGKLGAGMTNDARGRLVREALSEVGVDSRPADVCPLCEDIFEVLPRFAENVAEAVNAVESENFLVGTKVEPSILRSEEEIRARHGIDSAESIKTELNREIGKLALPLIDRAVEFGSPQVVALVDTRFGEVSLDIAPVFIAGRYNKYSREIPQTIWPCRECHGKGCPHCGGRGKMYETSVQEIIGDVALEMADGREHFFHGMGREDIDARMLGDGRPFVLEISQPRRRFIDLAELERRSRVEGVAEFSGLHFVGREAVERYKAAEAEKVYRVRVKADGNINIKSLDEVALSFEDADIEQRTPRRVAHRRADLVRTRRILWVKADSAEGDEFVLEMRTASGTYVKEFVSGDDGRTQPNFSDRLGVRCAVTALDVLAIDYHEPRGDSNAEIERNQDEDPQPPEEEAEGPRAVPDNQRSPDLRARRQGQHHHRPQRAQGHAPLQVTRPHRRRGQVQGRGLRGQRQGREQDEDRRRAPRAPRQDRGVTPMGEEYVSVAELRELLEEVQEERGGLDLASQRASLDHAQKTCHISKAQADAIIEEVRALGLDLGDQVCVKIADLLPEYPEDVRAILSKERVTLEKEQVEAILEIVRSNSRGGPWKTTPTSSTGSPKGPRGAATPSASR